MSTSDNTRLRNTHLNSLTRIKRFFLRIVHGQLQKKDSKASSVTSTCHLTPTDDSLNGFRTYYSLSTSFYIELINMTYCIITNHFVNSLCHHLKRKVATLCDNPSFMYIIYLILNLSTGILKPIHSYLMPELITLHLLQKILPKQLSLTVQLLKYD